MDSLPNIRAIAIYRSKYTNGFWQFRLSFFDLPENDLLKQGKDLENFVKDNDVIIHTAAVNRGTDEEIIAGSVVAVYNLISAIKKLKKRPKLIFLSSIQAETDTLYGMAKKMAEIILEDFSKKNKAPVSIFRLTNVFGEGCRPFYNSVIATFCYQVANNQDLKINGNSKFKFIYIGDLIKIINKELKIERKNNFYLKKVSSVNEVSISDLARIIQSFKNKPKLKSKFHKILYKTYLSYKNGK